MKKSTVYLASLVFAFATSASALDKESVRSSFNPKASNDQCAELLKECVALKSDESKNSCFKESSEHLFCAASPLGELAKKRWQLQAVNFADLPQSAQQGELKIVNKTCIENFDNVLSSKLIAGQVSSADSSKMSDSLESCKLKDTIDLQRQ